MHTPGAPPTVQCALAPEQSAFDLQFWMAVLQALLRHSCPTAHCELLTHSTQVLLLAQNRLPQSVSKAHWTQRLLWHTLLPVQSSSAEQLAPSAQLPVQLGLHVPSVHMPELQSSEREQLPPTEHLPLHGRHWFNTQYGRPEGQSLPLAHSTQLPAVHTPLPPPFKVQLPEALLAEPQVPSQVAILHGVVSLGQSLGLKH
jgi:hypothetical protein